MTKSGKNTIDHLYETMVEWRDKAERLQERVRYLEGATNHAGGTPLSLALRELAAYKGLVERWVEWSKGAISELSDVIVRLDPKGHVLQGIMEEMPPEKPEGM